MRNHGGGRPRRQLTGQRFGRLLVLGPAPPPERATYKGLWWQCECDCGAVRPVYGSNLAHGHTISCGCYRRERTAAMNRRSATPSPAVS